MLFALVTKNHCIDICILAASHPYAPPSPAPLSPPPAGRGSSHATSPPAFARPPPLTPLNVH